VRNDHLVFFFPLCVVCNAIRPVFQNDDSFLPVLYMLSFSACSGLLLSFILFCTFCELLKNECVIKSTPPFNGFSHPRCYILVNNTRQNGHCQ